MYRKIGSVLVALFVAVSCALPQPSVLAAGAQTQVSAPPASPGERLTGANGQFLLSGRLSGSGSADEKSASAFLEKNGAALGLRSPSQQLRLSGTHKDGYGNTFMRYSQTIRGLRVYGRALTVRYDKNGVVRNVSASLECNQSVSSLGTGSITGDDAVADAERVLGGKGLRAAPSAEEMIDTYGGQNYRVYRVALSYLTPSIRSYEVFVEATTGKILRVGSLLREDGAVTGTGIDVLGDTVPLNLTLSGSLYYMLDATRPAVAQYIATGDYGTVDASGNLFPVSGTQSSFTSAHDRASVSAQHYAECTVDFYKNLFGRSSLDNQAMPVFSVTHYGTNYNDAYWDGSEVIYGDGDGSQFGPLSGDLSIVGHEMTHGVIQHTADLDYNNQSGALNESLADTFGVLIKTYAKYGVAGGGSWTFDPSDWEIGGDAYTPSISGDALRSLSDPAKYGQPDNMSGYVQMADTQAGDYGGVHENSGIPSRAAFLIAQSVGMAKTAQIYYYALANYMQQNTDFIGAENCLMQAAADLYPSEPGAAAAVESAFSQVGVDNITGVALSSYPAAVTYALGQAIDLTGAAITVTYAGGAQKTLNVTADMVSGYQAGKTGAQTVTVTYGGHSVSFGVTVVQPVSVAYDSHVQDIGWQSWVSDGALSGTTGRALRMEAMTAGLTGAPAGLHLLYRAHVQNIGWQDWVSDRAAAGTTGQGLCIEAFEFCLTGTDASLYSVEYQAYVQNIGWQDWVKDGAAAGTTGQSLRVEALHIRVVPRIPDVVYQGHVQNIGWQAAVSDGALSGTTGRSLRVEALEISLANAPAGLHILYRAHVQNIGWQGWVSDGALSGTTGQGLRVEALEITLSGADAARYTVRYQAHVQSVGWQSWVSDGALSGTTGRGLRVEALRIQIQRKD